MSKNVFLCACLLMIAVATPFSYAVLSLAKENYLLDEIVNINVAYPEEYSISIITPSNIYKYLGAPEGDLSFRPQEEGRHSIELHNSIGDIIAAEGFSVWESMQEFEEQAFYPDKYIYESGETVILHFGQQGGEYSIRITAAGKNYYYPSPSSPLLFVPKSQGKHDAVIIKEEIELAKTSFEIKRQKKKISISDKDGNAAVGRVNFYSGSRVVATKRIDELEKETFFENRTYDVEIITEMKGARKIYLKNVAIKESISLGVEDIPAQQGFIKSFAIDPTMLNFTEGVVSGVAEGNALYKCAEWDFLSRSCMGSWQKQMDLIPGQEYEFIINQADPGYGESGSVPEPHPVTGYVYYNNNISRADNGIPVIIKNNANQEFRLTQVYAPPIPAYKGAYSADIYGVTGDMITVRAWNQTQYGETNATLDATTTRVNVTFFINRSSEPNVSFILPANNSLFNISSAFNVTVSVGVLGQGGTGCYATLSLTDNIAQLLPGGQYTTSLGDINLGEFRIITWNFTAVSGGKTNISVNASCLSDGTILEGKDIAVSRNITVADQVKPDITQLMPLNWTEATNPVIFEFNATDHTGLSNCTLFLDSSPYSVMFSPGRGIRHSFNLTLDAGSYAWKIGCYDNSSYFNYNESETWLFTLPSWHFYYGNLSSRISLSGASNKSQFTWESQPAANLYVIETGTDISWLSLQALGRDINNISAPDDFSEADLNLSMFGFRDSINATFTQAYLPKKTAAVQIYNRIIKEVPVADSTDNPNFFTGILWDTLDGGSEYDGTQDLVFMTLKNQTHPGKYGIYDYEIRIPPSLRFYKLGSGTVSFYIELV